MLKILNKILGHTDEYKYNLLKQTHELLRKHHFEHHRDNCTLVPTDKLKEMQATISLINEGEPICDVCHIKPMLSCGCDVPENWKTEIAKRTIERWVEYMNENELDPSGKHRVPPKLKDWLDKESEG